MPLQGSPVAQWHDNRGTKQGRAEQRNAEAKLTTSVASLLIGLSGPGVLHYTEAAYTAQILQSVSCMPSIACVW